MVLFTQSGEEAKIEESDEYMVKTTGMTHALSLFPNSG